MKDINAEEYAALQNSENPVVIDFHATWCGPCKVLSPILEELESEVENVDFVKLDVDQYPEIAGANQVMGVPTVVILCSFDELKTLHAICLRLKSLVTFIQES